MPDLQKVFQWQTANGTPIRIKDMVITPQAKVLAVRLPFIGFVWQRPTAVYIQHPHQSERYPVPDVTRDAMRGITAAIGLITFILWLIRR